MVFFSGCFQYSQSPPKIDSCRLTKVVNRPTKDQLNAIKNPMAVVMPRAPDHRKMRCKKCPHSRTDGVLCATLSASCDFSMGICPSKIHVVTCFLSDKTKPLFEMVRIYRIEKKSKDCFSKIELKTTDFRHQSTHTEREPRKRCLWWLPFIAEVLIRLIRQKCLSGVKTLHSPR